MIQLLEIKGKGLHLKNLINIDSDSELDFLFNNQQSNLNLPSEDILKATSYSLNIDKEHFDIEDCYLDENLIVDQQTELQASNELIEALYALISDKAL